MGRNIPQTGAPIPEQTVEDIADEYGHDVEKVIELFETVQVGFEETYEEYRDHRVVAETEELMIVLSEYGFRYEAEDAGEDVDFEVGDRLADELSDILSEAHHDTIKLGEMRSLLGWNKQDITQALSANYPRIIRKPERGQPTFDDIDVEYEINYNNGYQAPYHFNGKSVVEISGEHGTLRTSRKFRAIPDDSSDEERDEIRVGTGKRHLESGKEFGADIHTFDLDEQLFGYSRRVDQFDAGLRGWVHDHVTADFQAEYETIERNIPICDECGAYPSDHVKVDQRSTRQFDPSTPDTLCNHCYASLLTELTKLSQQEAEVYALIESGLTHRQVAAALGSVSRSQVGTVMGRVKDKREKAEEEREQAKRTAELIDE